jgi:guanylate cyclase soluble subunit beta
MYGLIHNALKDMVNENFPCDTWEEIVSESGVSTDSFLTMRPYDDTTTIALIEASSRVLELPIEDCLISFGEYWITTFAPRDYEGVLKHAGASSFEFLKNLDDMHDRISAVYCDFKPPSFRVVNAGHQKAVILYTSGRKGLTPFVLGILQGLGVRFNEVIRIESVETKEFGDGEQSSINIRVE